MKKLIIFIILFLLLFGCRSQSFINYYQGDIPVILTVSHGGVIESSSITDRDCNKYTCVTDLNTIDVANQIAKYIKWGTPHMIVNYLDRSELDPNREEYVACADESCKLYYRVFHNFIKKAIDTEKDESLILILDIHGQAHSHEFIELGYDIERNDYKVNINQLNSSVQNIIGKCNESLIRGEYSLGAHYDKYYNVAPSPKNPIPPYPYFNGGYITEKYSKFDNVVVIQLELPYYIRKNYKSRKDFGKITAKIIEKYLKQHEKQLQKNMD